MRSTGVGLSLDERIALWDAGMAGVRAYLRSTGVREVTTPVRVNAPALEPYIEPLQAAGGFLATSPELAMKRLLCRGSGSIGQIAHCFRAGERGDRHREEFHLVEWYRVDATLEDVLHDVEAMVAVACDLGGSNAVSWSQRTWFSLFAETTGLHLRGDEDEPTLRVSTSRHALVPEMPAGVAAAPAEVRTLWAWTALFSSWSDLHLDAYLKETGGGLHLVDFPAPLAALARLGHDGEGRAIARRFESHWNGVEIANGYDELRNAAEQRTRFERVAQLRQADRAAPLPLDESFLEDLRRLALPACCGCALGLDRVLMLGAGQRTLQDVSLFAVLDSD